MSERESEALAHAELKNQNEQIINSQKMWENLNSQFVRILTFSNSNFSQSFDSSNQNSLRTWIINVKIFFLGAIHKMMSNF